MTKLVTQDTSPLADELTAVRFAFRALLISMETLAAKREQTVRFRAADRRFRRAHRAVQKQASELAVELHARGMSPLEINLFMEDAKREARAQL